MKFIKGLAMWFLACGSADMFSWAVSTEYHIHLWSAIPFSFWWLSTYVDLGQRSPSKIVRLSGGQVPDSPLSLRANRFAEMLGIRSPRFVVAIEPSPDHFAVSLEGAKITVSRKIGDTFDEPMLDFVIARQVARWTRSAEYEPKPPTLTRWYEMVAVWLSVAFLRFPLSAIYHIAAFAPLIVVGSINGWVSSRDVRTSDSVRTYDSVRNADRIKEIEVWSDAQALNFTTDVDAAARALEVLYGRESNEWLDKTGTPRVADRVLRLRSLFDKPVEA